MSKNRLQMQRRNLPAPQKQQADDLQDIYIEQGFQAGVQAAERYYQEVTLPINAKVGDLYAAISGAIVQVNLIAARIAGIDQVLRPQLKMTAQFIYDYYYQLDALLAKEGSAIADPLKSGIMEFHSAIMDYVTGRDNGDRLLQCHMMQHEKSLETRDLLSSIRFGAAAKDEVGMYIGEQLQKLMNTGMSQQDAVIELRKSLKDERQYIPDHRLDFPKGQALDILHDPYYQNANRFKLMRKRYRDRFS